MANLPHNIESRKGWTDWELYPYVGYANGPWHIRRMNNGKGWQALKLRDTRFYTGAALDGRNLAELGDKLADYENGSK